MNESNKAYEPPQAEELYTEGMPLETAAGGSQYTPRLKD